jgi:hypothetical protein
MAYILILIVLCVTVRAQLPYEIAINQTQQNTQPLIDQTNAAWLNTTSLFAELNAAKAVFVANLTQLYAGADAIVLKSMIFDCPVEAYSLYISNQTKTQAFLCCHVRLLRFPALLKVIGQAFNIYFGAPVDRGSEAMNGILENILQIRNNDLLGVKQAACLDDASISPVQCSYGRSSSANRPAADLLQLYQNLAYDVVSLQGCQTPSGAGAGCLVSYGLNLTVAAPNFLYSNIDPMFSPVCGSQALRDFETARLVVSC